MRWHMGVVHVMTDADIPAVLATEQTEDADTEEEDVVSDTVLLLIRYQLMDPHELAS